MIFFDMKKTFSLFVLAALLLASGCLFSQNHEYVDLGLPSGTLWATCNIGADVPEEYGDYFAWGETKRKVKFTWGNYKYCKDGDLKQLTKYCNNSRHGYNGYTDNLTVLQPTDDAATVNWGEEWQTPTAEQWIELQDHTNSTWTSIDGVEGRLFTGSNGKSIFLPASGFIMIYDGLTDASFRGYYWSSSLHADKPGRARSFWFGRNRHGMDAYGLCNGLVVRPVRSARKH